MGTVVMRRSPHPETMKLLAFIGNFKADLFFFNTAGGFCTLGAKAISTWNGFPAPSLKMHNYPLRGKIRP